MNDLFTLPFHSVHNAELPSAGFKQSPEDFQVFELMGFEPSGNGEHLWLEVKKREKNTQDIARDLARHFNVAKHAVTYSGLKDKNAVTQQWFSVHLPGKAEPSLPVFRNVDFLTRTRHSKKLKTGVHAGNRFIITLRDVTDLDALLANLERVKQQGFPNYFGHQRFGFDRGNLEQAQQWLSTGKRPRQRFLEGMYLSAVRSYLFNVCLSERVVSQSWDQLSKGEIGQFDWSKSGFVVENEQDERLATGEVHPAINLFDEKAALPEALASWDDESWFQQFRRKRFSPEQRALRVIPRNFSRHVVNEKDVELTFELPKGSYATSCLKEICTLVEPSRSE
jgi:tRNA pseudouridine13 synthase